MARGSQFVAQPAATRIVASRSYERRVVRLLSPDARAAAEAAIISRPDAWPIIQGTGGARKARVALPGRGKSGGARLIYFFSATPALIAFLDIYGKNAKQDLTPADKSDIRAAIAEIRNALRTANHGA